MKYSLIILFTLILFTGCGEKKENNPENDPANKFATDTTALSTAPIESANTSFIFQYKFEKGTKYNYRITTISEDKQTIKTDTSMQQDVSQNIVYLFNFEPVEVEQDGTSELVCEISSIKLEASSNDQKVLYNSDVKGDSAEILKYAEYEALVKNPFSIRLSGNGEILEIFRVDKILNKYLDIKNFSDSASAEDKKMIRADLIDGVLRPLSILVFREMPAKAVANDSTWSIAQNPQRFMVYKITNTSTYKVKGLESFQGDTLVKLEAGLNSEITGESRVTERGVTYNFKKPVTSSEGTIYFNLTDGLVQRSKTGTMIEISYTMEADSPQGKQRGSRSEKISNINIVERL